MSCQLEPGFLLQLAVNGKAIREATLTPGVRITNDLRKLSVPRSPREPLQKSSTVHSPSDGRRPDPRLPEGPTGKFSREARSKG
ncbi:hypothetical protein E2C01_047732 [Portunus trituberculatus]|uniref:Uncharacterized protein n=1 Tax=Portunus trituberculatus TaxID=210409 RepID=A0A5B7G1B7_PORTR|nr:hypothetical protein [Portunus trituberculatus]